MSEPLHGELPEVLAREASETAAVIQLRVAPDLAVFAGHFPGQPILPGIVQVLWAQALAEQAFDLTAEQFLGLGRTKFKAPVRPGDSLTLTLTVGRQIRFRFERDGETCTDGTLRYGGES